MITLITGTPGSGKSLLAVARIKDALDQGRQVYSDIDGLTLQVAGVSPSDWRETPEGSLVVYDEAQKHFPSSGRPGAANVSEVIRALETHRHTGHDIIYITQHPTFIDSHLRKLVGEHIHVRRPANAKMATLFKANEVMSDPQRPPDFVDKEVFRYPKELFNCYKSATVHTHKFKIPTSLKVIGISLFALSLFFGYRMMNGGLFGFMETEADEKKTSPDVVAIDKQVFEEDDEQVELDPLNKALKSSLDRPSLPSLSSCRQLGDTCSCYDTDKQYVAMTPAQCSLLVRRGTFVTHSKKTNDEDNDDEKTSDSKRPIVDV